MGIVLMRHGETDWNQAGKLQGTLDIALNRKGRQQVEAACHSLLETKETAFSVIVSSPLKRASESAQICGDILGIPIAIMDNFRERSFGKLQGQQWQEIVTKYGIEDMEEVLALPHLAIESVEQMQERVFQGLEQVRAQYIGQHVLILTHGSVIKWTMRDLQREVGIIHNAACIVLE